MSISTLRYAMSLDGFLLSEAGAPTGSITRIEIALHPVLAGTGARVELPPGRFIFADALPSSDGVVQLTYLGGC